MTTRGGEHRDHRDRRPADRAGVLPAEGVLSAHGAAPAGAAPRFAFRSHLELFDAGDDALRIVEASGRVRAIVRGPEPWQRSILLALDSAPQSVSQLASSTGGHTDAVEAALTDLASLELVEEVFDGVASTGRFDRQIMYFASRLGSHHEAQRIQERLRGMSVVIVGCGGLGSWVAAGLACSGIGRLRLIDFDDVALDNLNRQILFRHEDIGTSKVTAAAGFLRAFDPELLIDECQQRIESLAHAVAAVDGYDAIVEAADWPPYELTRWLGEAATERRIAHLSLAQQPPLVRVGPLRAPGLTACHACWEEAARNQYPLYERLVQSRIARGLRPAATTGFASALVASVAVSELVHHLGGLGARATLKRAWTFDLTTLETRWEDLAAKRCTHW